MNEVDEVVDEFLVESFEGLDQLDRDLLALEDDPDAKDALASAFRTIHTVKGTCGFLGFTTLESVAHAGESLLAKLRDGSIRVDPEITSALLALSDAVRELLARVADTGHDDGDHEDLLATLRRLEERGPGAARPQATSRLGDLLVDAGAARPVDIVEAIARQAGGDQRPLGKILVDMAVVTAAQVEEALAVQERERSTVVDTARVQMALLDDMLALVAELAAVRNAFVGLADRSGSGDLPALTHRLDAVTSRLQARAVEIRAQPVATVWAKFPRIVRDLAHACGKRVRLEMEGAETELDRSVLEAVKAPLAHLVRNAVDHGIEAPEARLRAGKPRLGRITLRASRESDVVLLEVADDGAGIDPARLRAAAARDGVVPAERVDRLDDADLVDLIFTPGVTTATEVTNLSGRGVGMDVVRTNIERIGGTVGVRSVPSQGTAFLIAIPLAWAACPPAGAGRDTAPS